MLDHVGFAVADIGRSKSFYAAALRPLGIEVIKEVGEPGHGAVGLGANDRPFFWIAEGSGPVRGVHVAFAAPDRKTVEAFHAAALAAGGTDNGAPGLRPHYHPGYYGAFVRDPDGNNIEAVCHRPD